MIRSVAEPKNRSKQTSVLPSSPPLPTGIAPGFFGPLLGRAPAPALDRAEVPFGANAREGFVSPFGGLRQRGWRSTPPFFLFPQPTGAPWPQTRSKPSAGANRTQAWVSRNDPPTGLCPSRATPAHANPLPGLCPRSSPSDRQGFSRPAKEGHKRLAQGLGLWENGTALPVPAAPPCQGCQRSQGRFWCPSTPSHPHGRVPAQPGHPRGS